MLEGYLIVLVKARGLSLDRVKEFLLDTIAGKSDPTKQQMAAAGHALKALGCGVSVRAGFNGKVTVTPENTQVVFSDGLDGK
jgi:hypothetical protein